MHPKKIIYHPQDQSQQAKKYILTHHTKNTAPIQITSKQLCVALNSVSPWVSYLYSKFKPIKNEQKQNIKKHYETQSKLATQLET